jgi:CRP-like cAMP-binding protein
MIDNGRTIMQSKNTFELFSDFLNQILQIDSSLFKEADLWKIVSIIKIHYLKHGDLIFSQGDFGQSVYIIANGTVKGIIEYQDLGKLVLWKIYREQPPFMQTATLLCLSYRVLPLLNY